MDSGTGKIHHVTQEVHNEMTKVFESREFKDDGKGQMIPLTNDQETILTPMNCSGRKGWMRNQPCPCGSQKKFKKCCWGRITKKRGE